MPELYLKEPTVFHGFYPLAARLLELTLKLERLDIVIEPRSKFSTDFLVGWAMIGIVEVQFFEMSGAVATCTKQASVTKLHVSVVWAFLQKQSFSSKTETAQWCSLSLSYFLSIISTFVIHSDVFHRRICYVENLFIFAKCFVGL